MTRSACRTGRTSGGARVGLPGRRLGGAEVTLVGRARGVGVGLGEDLRAARRPWAGPRTDGCVLAAGGGGVDGVAVEEVEAADAGAGELDGDGAADRADPTISARCGPGRRGGGVRGRPRRRPGRRGARRAGRRPVGRRRRVWVRTGRATPPRGAVAGLGGHQQPDDLDRSSGARRRGGDGRSGPGVRLTVMGSSRGSTPLHSVLGGRSGRKSGYRVQRPSTLWPNRRPGVSASVSRSSRWREDASTSRARSQVLQR